MNNLQISFISTIADIDKVQYDKLISTDYPFIQYEFLIALESSAAVSESSGWKSCHLVIHKDDSLVAFVPLYLKTHSYGEYVFDFEWAKAYQQSGLNYYPKLVSSIPFTPVTGSRISHCEDYSLKQILPIVNKAVQKYALKLKASSWHLLFPQPQVSQTLSENGLLQKTGVQFHWFNKDYKSFNEFLQTINSKRRKDIRRERKKIVSQNIVMSVLESDKISVDLWNQFYQFYQLTYAKRSGHGGYLPASFFKAIGKFMPNNVLLIAAYHEDEIVAASLFFKDQETLYGRYWGCNKEYDFLHFETCYYQGIDYCIKHNLQKFDAGAQGEHKIQRGFEPVKTFSNHWIENQRFSDAISHYLSQEKQYTENYFQEIKSRSPFK